MNIRLINLLFVMLLSLVLIVAAGCDSNDDDDNDNNAPADDDAQVDDDSAADDDLTDDDAADDDVTDDDTVDDDTVDDDTVDDDTVDDDTVDDDTTDDDTVDDDTADDDATPVIGCIEGDFDPYWGNLHSHTKYSDGELTPAHAFAWARDMAGLDIMVVTDHVEQLYLPFPDDRWGKCLEQAEEAYDPGNYLTDCGYEYGSGFILPWFQSTGHNNVFFPPYLFPIVQLDFHNFYNSLVECPTCVGQFNHPGDDPQMTWNNWEYFADVDATMNLFEFNSDVDVWPIYFDALAAGWHVSPMHNQDNHGADWGTKNDDRSGFFLAELNREALHDAMMARRSFQSTDKNAYIRMMADDTCWMGSILSGYSSMALFVEVSDIDVGDGFETIELYGPGPALIDSYSCSGSETCSTTFNVDITGSTYFVARATQTDAQFLVAAPIWVEP